MNQFQVQRNSARFILHIIIAIFRPIGHRQAEQRIKSVLNKRMDDNSLQRVIL